MLSRRNVLIFGSSCLACPALAVGDFPRSEPPAATPGAATAPGCGFDRVDKLHMTRVNLAGSGSRTADQVIARESVFLNRYFGVSPRWQYHDDDGHDEALTLRDANGVYITIGKSLIEHEIAANSEEWSSVLIGILAHEWAHAFQYDHGLQERAYLWETHADYMAGWYLGTREAAESVQLNVAAFARALAKRANRSGYFDEDSHGSPAQRTTAMYAGVEFGRNDYVTGYRPNVATAAGAGYAYVKQLRRS
ncbi:hypothetical protein [Pseudoduganella sp. R-34]|uniref:hypothetical protein n=1 Tax=Pseudoduganella sp. R-34 TaxID=3404062 RepID=UPI003CF04469